MEAGFGDDRIAAVLDIYRARIERAASRPRGLSPIADGGGGPAHARGQAGDRPDQYPGAQSGGARHPRARHPRSAIPASSWPRPPAQPAAACHHGAAWLQERLRPQHARAGRARRSRRLPGRRRGGDDRSLAAALRFRAGRPLEGLLYILRRGLLSEAQSGRDHRRRQHRSAAAAQSEILCRGHTQAAGHHQRAGCRLARGSKVSRYEPS